MTALDLVGQRFQRLVVIDRAANDPRSHKSRWLCRCDCNQQIICLGANLQSGNSASCGCLRRERTKEANTKHGHCANGRRSATWISWQATKQRVLNPRASNFSRFGARGFTINARWRGPRGFINFLADMGTRPAGKTLRFRDGRIYQKSAVAWMTAKEQTANRRK